MPISIISVLKPDSSAISHPGAMVRNSRTLFATSFTFLPFIVGAWASLNWTPCDPKSVQSEFPVDCAFFPIPLDYFNHSAGTGRLSLIKMNATGERKGTLFVNPGGPGVPASEVAFLGLDYMTWTGGNYDIVSWDPRGVGFDTIPSQTMCFDHSTEFHQLINGTIEDTGIEWAGNFTNSTDIATLYAQALVMEKIYQAIAQACKDAPTGDTLKYIGTASNVRDMVALADTLDGPGSPVNYWGISYGTLLGAWFVNMFPDRVGHVILDGVVNIADMALKQSYLSWGDKIHDDEKILHGFATACALAGPLACNITSEGWTGAEVLDLIGSIIDAAHVMETESRTDVVASETIRELLLDAFYEPSRWAATSGELGRFRAETADRGRAGRLETMVSGARYSKRQSSQMDGTYFAAQAIYCADSVDPDGTTMAQVLQYLVTLTMTVSPTFGALWPVDVFYCPFWSVRAVERYTGPFGKKPARPILVIGNTADPITPFTQAKQFADVMGDGATLIQQNGFGHASMAQQSKCVADIFQGYLNNDTLPAGDDTFCEVDDDQELFPGVNTREVISKLYAE
ncbi:alpha/beta-hydrolase [Daedaleopsis nitida]|nr:alpha/beta-hydrolase [Daedaleopsis nitida]